MSAITGNTTESKAVRYAATEGKKAGSQYVGTISTLTDQLETNNQQVLDLQMKLNKALESLKLKGVCQWDDPPALKLDESDSNAGLICIEFSINDEDDDDPIVVNVRNKPITLDEDYEAEFVLGTMKDNPHIDTPPFISHSD